LILSVAFPRKSANFLEHGFRLKEMVNPTSNWTRRKVCFLHIEWYKGW
jgi:hypothetical protein